MTDDDAYFNSEEFKAILQQYEESVKVGQPIYMDADDLADIADYYHFEDRIEEANEAINLALQFNPTAVGPLLYKAREALSLQDFEKAREYAERIETLDSLEYLYLKCEILICEGKVEEADDIFREHFKEVPADEYIDYVYDVANLYSEYQQHNKAFEWMARSKGDDSDDFKELMARTLFGLGKYKDSERIFSELIDRNPFSNRYWYSLASAQFMNEDYNASVTSSEYAIAIAPDDADSILAKANGLFRLENYEEALSYYERYNRIIEDDEFSYLHQGTCLVNLGRYSEAIASLEKAEEVAPEDSLCLPEIYQEFAFAYNELKQPDTALYYIDKTRSLDCDHVEMDLIKAHILLSDQRIEEAEKMFKKAIANSDNAYKTMLRIMVSLYDNRYVKASYHLFKKFFKHIDNNWKEGFSYMALCCYDLKKYDEFIDYLRISVEKNPREAKLVLGPLFPTGMQVNEYESYITNQLKNK